jgi:hypothetical protein
MRLTLRTMLAYLDNALLPADAKVLLPADAEALGKKINESDFASGLVERVKVALKKLRMDAPKVDGKGMGNDANTVAEYLDSSLPQDRVGDFERVCLESDKHLCEVAACHQILTLVLGQPAEVPTNLRDRIYALGHPEQMPARHDGAPVGRNDSVKPPPVVRANGQAAPVTVAPLEVPEYLRSGRTSSVWPLVLTLAATFLIGIGVLRAIGPFDASHPLLKLFRGSTQIAAVPPEKASPTTASNDSKSQAEETNIHPSSESAAKESSATVETQKQPATAPAVSTVTPTVPATAPPAAVASVPPVTESATKPADAAVAATVPAAPPSPDPAAIAAAKTAAAAALPQAVRPPPKVEVKPPVEVGRYTSDGQILAALDPDDGLWYLKPARRALVAGERLAILPTYRPQAALPGVQITFAGEGSVRMQQPVDGGPSRMAVDFGRFVIVPVAAAGEKIALDMAGVKGVATLVDADSSLAIKVARWLPPGADPLTAPGMPVVEIFNLSGRVTWQEAEQEKVEIPTHFVHIYMGIDPGENHGPFQPPEWIDSKSVPPIDRSASLVLAGLLDANPSKPLILSLQEQATDRRVEVRSLVARCLALLDEFEPVIHELSDNRQYSFWPTEVDSLRLALARSPETAAQIKAVLERQRSSDAVDLQRLLSGYSAADLEKGGAAQLVKFLEHEQMDVRVLAFYNLVSITGEQHLYRPEKPPGQVRGAISSWKERLTSGKIAYKALPSPLENYKPLGAPAAAPFGPGGR